jgi:hypothetical protein
MSPDWNMLQSPLTEAMDMEFYTLLDHAIARAERGLVGVLHVEGQPNTEIFDGKIEPGMGH